MLACHTISFVIAIAMDLLRLFRMKSAALSVLVASLMFLSMMSDSPSVKTLVTINKIQVMYDSVDSLLVYTSGMNIDADGSPHAYHPVSDSGSDALANAGRKGNWWGIVTDAKGNPVVQGKNDPCPGYYVSTTALYDATKKETDPHRYVNSDSIPYIVLPNNAKILSCAKKGDFAFVENLRNGKSSYAIFADVGPKDKVGEGSIKLAANLGIDADPRTGGQSDSVKYTVLCGSGNGKPRRCEEIDSLGKAIYAKRMK